MDAVDYRQEEEVLEELAARECVPRMDQPDPLDDLEYEEQNTEPGGQDRIALRGARIDRPARAGRSGPLPRSW